MTGQLRPCGTSAAYNRHLRHGEKPCDVCQAGNTARAKARYRNSEAHRALVARRALARQRAFARLKAMHPDDYRRLYAEEMERSARGEAK